MNKIFKILLVLFSSFFLTSCGTMMKDVMASCDRGQSFDAYVYCVKSTYQTQGTRPNSSATRAFYANLDAVNEAYTNNKITQAQAKKLAYDAYMNTIHADNERNEAVSNAAFMNALGAMQQQQQQQQQQVQPIRAPVQTNCYRNGNITNCTSY